MGKRSIVFVAIGMIVFLVAAFFAGYAISFVPENPKSLNDDIGNLKKLTSLEVSSDLMDPNMVKVYLTSNRKYSPQELAVSTLECVKKLSLAGQVLDKWLKVKFCHKFFDRKIDFIVSTDTIKNKNSGATGNIEFWNQALATMPQQYPTGKVFSGVDGFVELYRSLEPEADVTFADRTLNVSSQSKLNWKANCLGLVMSVHACAQSVGFYPDKVEMVVNDGDRNLSLRFSGTDLKSLMQGQLTPQEFQTRIVMGWLNN
jgi:hypothetical protein